MVNQSIPRQHKISKPINSETTTAEGGKECYQRQLVLTIADSFSLSPEWISLDVWAAAGRKCGSLMVVCADRIASWWQPGGGRLRELRAWCVVMKMVEAGGSSLTAVRVCLPSPQKRTSSVYKSNGGQGIQGERRCSTRRGEHSSRRGEGFACNGSEDEG